MTAPNAVFLARQPLATLPAPERAKVIVRTLRVAEPDEADEQGAHDDLRPFRGWQRCQCLPG